MSILKKKTVTTVEEAVKVLVNEEKKENSMAVYIGALRHEVSELIPRFFKHNDDLRLGIVAFGDYCDMENAKMFGNAYQCMPITNNENDLIKFVKERKDTFRSGHKTATLVEAAVSSRGTMKSRMYFDAMMEECDDTEIKGGFASYKAERDNI